jgi:phosphatidylethanolamine/phosphatidyl-N-methylethanolamine N-methyltransferase
MEGFVTLSHPVERSGNATFFREWLSNPLRVASVAPSGRALAEMMTRDIDASSAPVIELGPGTGIFTDALLAHGVPEDRLALIEKGASFAVLLRRRHPLATVLEMDATRIGRATLFGGDKAGAVISGLPVLAMPPRVVMQIVHGCFVHLREGGAMYQFTYGPTCPVKRQILDRLNLQAKRVGGAFINLPPASVYRITRRAPI